MRDIKLADTIYMAFTTRAFATGIPTVLAGSPVVSAYEDAGLTQITAGITLGVDHDSVVGLNMLTIVATGANGYESGKDYNMVITTGTVDSVSVVGEVVAQFSIARSAAAQTTATDGVVLAADAITEAKIADNAIATEHIATGAITADSIAANAIGASEIATDAIGADELAASAVTEIVAGMNDLSAADVNAEVVDVMTVDTVAEAAQGAPANTDSIADMVQRLYSMGINLVDVDAGFKEFNNAAGTVTWKKALADDGSNYTEAKGETGP